MDLLNYYNQNKINYKSLNLHKQIRNNKDVDVSIIIPVKNRENFNTPLTKHLLKAIERCKDKSFSITFVEHDVERKHEKYCNGIVNYIWIPSNNGVFNKCFAFNVGVLYSNKAKYYLFHDLDIIMQSDFFIKLFKNLEHYNTPLQSFTKRRVVYFNDEMTDKIINANLNIDTIVIDNDKVKPGTPGAPGGSIFIKAEDFFNLGGWDAELFYGYSCEDAFFYKKMENFTGINSCNQIPIELFHMNHPPLYSSNPDIKTHLSILDTFNKMSQDDKIKFINMEKANIK